MLHEGLLSKLCSLAGLPSFFSAWEKINHSGWRTGCVIGGGGTFVGSAIVVQGSAETEYGRPKQDGEQKGRRWLKHGGMQSRRQYANQCVDEANVKNFRIIGPRTRLGAEGVELKVRRDIYSPRR